MGEGGGAALWSPASGTCPAGAATELGERWRPAPRAGRGSLAQCARRVLPLRQSPGGLAGANLSPLSGFKPQQAVKSPSVPALPAAFLSLREWAAAALPAAAGGRCAEPLLPQGRAGMAAEPGWAALKVGTMATRVTPVCPYSPQHCFFYSVLFIFWHLVGGTCCSFGVFTQLRSFYQSWSAKSF